MPHGFKLYAMKKITLIAIMIIGGFFAYSQQVETYVYKLLYDMYLDFGNEQLFEAELLFNKEQARFNYQEKEIQEESLKEDENDDGFNFHISIKDSTKYFIISNLSKNRVVQLEKSLDRKGNNVLVHDDLQQIEWIITDSTKMIGAYQCNQAHGHFGGRDYTVWFAPQVPVYFGPHKLHGLPGVVLEAYDDMYEVGFICTNIETGKYLYDHFDKEQYGETISRAEYIEDLKKGMDDRIKRISSRMGRDIKIQSQSFVIQSIERYD